MVVANVKRIPLNYNDAHQLTFSSLEDAMRHLRNQQSVITLSIKEDEGWHYVKVDKNGGACPLESWLPSGGKVHRSELYTQIEKQLREETSKPKLL